MSDSSQHEPGPVASLAERGLRVTRQRVAVLERLRASEDHPTAAELYRGLLPDHPHLSLKTVYEALDTLVDASLARCVTAPGGGPSRYDPKTVPHYHAQCRVCGSLTDVHAAADGHIRGRSKLPAGFELEQIRVTLVGRCRRCRKAG